MDPRAADAQPPMPGTELQVVSEEPLEIGKDRGRRGRVEAVAALVDAQPRDLERPGHAADGCRPLEDDHLVASLRRPPRRGQAGRPGAEDRDHGAAGKGSSMAPQP